MKDTIDQVTIHFNETLIDVQQSDLTHADIDK